MIKRLVSTVFKRARALLPNDSSKTSKRDITALLDVGVETRDIARRMHDTQQEAMLLAFKAIIKSKK